MKPLGIALLFLTVVLISMMKSHSLKLKVLAIRQAEGFLRELGRCMRYWGNETGRTLQTLAQKYDRLTFLKGWSDELLQGVSPEAALQSVLDEKLLGKTVSNLLLSYAGTLGRHDGETAELVALEYAEKMQFEAQNADAEYRDKGRLYRGLGLYLGAALAVVLI